MKQLTIDGFEVDRRTAVERVFGGIRRRVEELVVPEYRQFGRITRITGGGLPRRTFAALRGAIISAPPGDVVEIGAGRGASTVVIAEALRKRGTGNLISVDKFEGGIYTELGEYVANLARFESVLERFSVDDIVSVFPFYLDENNVDELLQLATTPQFAALFVDADGRLDKYLPALWKMLPIDAPLVFDDYSNDIRWFRPKSERYPDGGAKHMRCYRLVHCLAELGYLSIERVVYGTVFCKKTQADSLSPATLERFQAEMMAVDNIYAAWRAREQDGHERSH